MPLDLKNVHQTEKIPGTTEFRLVRIHPTCSLKQGDEPEIFIQDGGIYYEGGQTVPNPPPWFWEQVRGMSPERRQQLGLRLPEEGPPPAATEISRPASPMRPSHPRPQSADKTCPACGKADVKNMGSHKRFCKGGG